MCKINGTKTVESIWKRISDIKKAVGKDEIYDSVWCETDDYRIQDARRANNMLNGVQWS